MALIIADDFSTGTHGERVVRAATEAGFAGPIVRRQLYRRDDPILDRAEQALAKPQVGFLEAFDEAALHGQLHLLREVTHQLERVLAAGTESAALSFSQGLSKAHIVRLRFRQLLGAWTGARGHVVAAYSDAFGVDAERLQSDPGERARLFQRIVDRVHASLHGNPHLDAARANYRRAVRALEQRRVSVAVVAENDGTLLDQMARLTEGRKPNVPPDFYDNPLSGPGVVTVGALDEDHRVAPYSSPSPQVSFFALGTVDGAVGTSYAAPRVAALLARLHHDRPQASNREVEGLATEFLRSDVPYRRVRPAGALTPNTSATVAPRSA